MPAEDSPDVRFEFSFDAQPVKEVLKASSLSASVGGKKLFENVNLTLLRGEKLAVVGANPEWEKRHFLRLCSRRFLFPGE